MNQILVGRWMLVVSVGIHAYAFFATPEFTPTKSARVAEPSMIKLTVAKPAPAPDPAPAPAPDPEADVAPPPEILEPAAIAEPLERLEPVPAESQQAAPESAPSASPEVASESAPVELTGTTLAAPEGWDAPKGSGGERRGALRPGVSRRVVSTSRRIHPAAPPAQPESSVLPLAELSKHPVPPALGGALKRNYPRDAQRQGQGGEAKVRARIEASGQVILAKVAFESADGFGSACLKTLVGSKWSAPLDKKGKPVATWVSYRCKFRIDE